MRNLSLLIHRPLALTLSLGIAAALCGCASGNQAKPAPSISPRASAPALQPAATSHPAPQTPLPLTADQRRTQALIQQVERAFHSGELHYRKGQLVQAKMDFDSAVDIMLASGLDLNTDPLLNSELNRILDAVNALEMEALKQGNGFAPAVEPTPADVANDVTFEVDPNLIAKAREELATTKSDLQLVINDYVGGFINFFANSQRGHNTLKHSLERGGRYKAMIQRVLGEEGVPQDLIYLAVAESGFQPHAVNGGSGAGGMWQFMPHGDYGLTRNAWVDERFDPEKSTRAYARYMKFLYNQLGDWYLAMAAYDWGAGNVQRAVQKTGYADYWELYKRNNLPGETKNYVPEILAAIIIAKNPTQYGFDDVQPDSPVTSDTVAIDYSVDLRLAADLVDVPTQQLLELNPGLLRLSTPPASALTEPFQLHLPSGTAAIFQQRIANFPGDKRNQWRYHRVKPDDSLSSVAQSYHVSVEQLATVNQLQRNDDLAGIEALIVPVPLPAAPIKHSEIYRARRGDTLVTIADRFSVSLEDLHRWNHLAGNSVAAGQRIRVEEPLRLASQARDRSHKSQSDSLTSNPSRPETSARKSKTTRNSTSAAKGAATQTPSKHQGSSRYAHRGRHSASHRATSSATHGQTANKPTQPARPKTEHKNNEANKNSTAKKKIQK